MNTHSESISPNKQALAKIRDLKRQLAEAKAATGEPIAIVSMACRFPKQSRTPELFWQSLLDQTDQVSDIPADRWDLDAFHDDDPEVPGKMYARRGVFLDDIDKMDPEFFGISPREATWVDPQQRLLLEVGWEAMERAGWTAEKIGEHTGVFVGWMHNDYQNEASDSFLNLNPYIATGAAGSFLCGRLAYYLGLQGPSVAVDTACSSSLVALHLAIQSLQRRDCDRALVGGVNTIVSPTTNILTCKLKALSPTGQSRAFDAAADGYLRGEGCGVVTLRRLSDAEADCDPILGIVRGSAVGHNGSSSGLTAPNPKAQQKVIRQALREAKIQPEEVGYLEAHGTGTELGDPIEIRAAAAALGGDRTDENPLMVGSVKTNIGHLEAASGMAGLIKVLLAMQNDQIPGQLNFETPNPHIPWDKIPVKVLTEPAQWPDPSRKIAGVSAFGMSGTNAHVVVEAPRKIASATEVEHPVAASTEGVKKASSAPQLITLSGKSELVVEMLCEAYGEKLASDPTVGLADVAYTSQQGRSHFEHRAAVVACDRVSAIKQLRLLGRSAESDGSFFGHGRREPKVAWQFTGQGSQYVGMGRQLYDQEPVFRAAIDHCDEQIRQWRDQSLVDVLFEDDQLVHHTFWTQPSIFSIQMGLVKLLTSWGVRPAVVLGHSVGQYAAACVAGVMSWEDGLRLIAERGRTIGALPSGGKMLAVFAPADAVEAMIQSDDSVSLAALNGTHAVVSGSEAGVMAVESEFTKRGVRTKILQTSHAFHSSLMDSALPEFESIANTVEFQPPQIPLVCNVSGKLLAVDQQLSGAYWAKHIRAAVRFADGIDVVAEMGCDVILEVGPQAVLSRMAAANWKRGTQSLISCLQKDMDDSQSLLQAVARLYVHGARPDFEAMDGGSSRHPALLPTYPFQRRRFWGPDKPRAFHAEYHTAHPLLGSPVRLAGVENEERFESFVEPDSPAWLPDHEVMGDVVMPGAAYVEMAIRAAESNSVQAIKFEQPLRPNSRSQLQTVVRNVDDTRVMETYSCPAETKIWTRNFSAKIADGMPSRPADLDRVAIEQRCAEVAQSADFYRKMLELGLNYGEKFQTVQSLRFSKNEVLARLETNGDIRGYTIPPTMLDGALHCLAVGLLREDDGNLFLPVGIDQVNCYQAIENEVWCHAKWNVSEGKLRTADLVLFSDLGQVAVEIQGLTVQQVSVAALRQMSGKGAQQLVYDLGWERLRLPAPIAGKKKWLVVDGRSPGACVEAFSLASTVVDQLMDRGHEVVFLRAQDGIAEIETNELAPGHVEVSMSVEQPENWAELFARLASEDTKYKPDGILWLLGGRISQSGESQENHVDPKMTQRHCSGVLALAAALSAAGQRSIECGLQLVTENAMAVDGDGGVGLGEASDANQIVDPAQTQFWGLGRVLGAEQPEYRCRLIDLSAGEDEQPETIEALLDILLTETSDNQMVVRGGQLFVPRMKQVDSKKKKVDSVVGREDASYLITGGVGKLGRQAAKWLAGHGAGQIVLVSRRQPDAATQEFLDSIRESSETVSGQKCDIIVYNADMGVAADVEKLFERFGGELKPLGGVIHAAGLVDDALLADQNWSRFEKVLAPKVGGAGLLHELTKSIDLDFFVLYSSAASVLGSPGQSNYATANAYLDGLAWQRRAMGLPATSINWGPWTEGMADDERIIKRLALQGITPLSVTDAHAAMESILADDVVQATVMDVDWRRMRMGLGGESPAMMQRLAPSRQKSQMGDSELVGKIKRLRGPAQRELVVKTMQQSLQGILSTPDVPETDRPLIEMGLDSLMAVEFGTELQQMLGDQFAVGPTMLFDHPTIDAISDFILALVIAESGETSETDPAEGGDAVVGSVATQRDDVAIIGLSCRFPGAETPNEFWQNLLNGVDSVREIPEDRWDMDQFFSADREPGKMYAREGGFLDGIADFDAQFFNISDQEACWVDPQHRMLLENSYLAMEHAGISPHPLKDANVGVFMGIMGQDYAFIPTMEDIDVIKAFQGAGLSHSAGVGRISYVFGFEGPSVAVDTASSSSLVALFQAVRSLQDGDCNLALAGGVNAILAPVNSLLMSKAGLLSPDGRCKSFSAQADGFGRGEGCGVVVLKRLSDAERDGDRIMAVVRGASVVHNGFSGGITSPSSKAQARVISEALKDAKVAPSQVQYLEAHGTGTEYGDPMELGAAASVYGKGRQRDQPLLVGSAKANISHLEAAGGVSGLIKTVLSLHHGVIPPQAHFDEPSPHIPWKRLPVKMVTEATAWPECELRLAGVTAIGLVGTNAHVVLSEAPGNVRSASDCELNPEKPTAVADAETDLADLVQNGGLNGELDEANDGLVLCDDKLSSDVGDQSKAAEDLAASSGTVSGEAVGGTGASVVTSHLLVLSARNDAALRQLAARYQSFFRESASERLADVCYTAAVGRRHFENRLAIVTCSKEAAVQQLSSFVGGEVCEGVKYGADGSKTKLGWLFNSIENHSTEIDSAIFDLYQNDEDFRDLMVSFDDRLKIHAASQGQEPIPLLNWLDREEISELDAGDFAVEIKQFVLQAGLAKLWQVRGVGPDAVLGVGVGHYVAACVAGVLGFEDALAMIVQRQTVMATNETEVADAFEAFADQFNFYPPNLPLVCSVSGETVPVHRSLGGSYWRQHCFEKTKLAKSMDAFSELGFDTAMTFGDVEVDATVQQVLQEKNVNSVSCLQDGQDVSNALLEATGALYVSGVTIDFKGLESRHQPQRVVLPGYPFQKKRYWITEIGQYVNENENEGATV